MYAIVFAAIAALYLLYPQIQAEWRDLVFFMVLVFVCEAMPVPLPKVRGTVSVSAPVIHALFMLFGPAMSAWIAAVGTLRWRDDLAGRPPLRLVLFNRSMLALSAVGGGYVYLGLGGTPGPADIWSSALPLATAAFTYTLVNAALAIGYMAIRGEGSPWGIWRMNMRWAIPNLVAFIPLSLLIAVVYDAGGPASVALFFVPLLMARQAFQRYMDMRTTYLQTITALSAALDAKDPSTHGHSARVAGHAVAVGRQLGVSHEDLELLEYVGILHDVGKLGVRDAVLKKPGLLTAAEYEEIKQHPMLGAQIVGGINLLGKGSAWIRHHHERYDGTGFPGGLAGEDIPLGARIVTVADAYDAMLSARSYKPDFTPERARQELVDCSGTQFDPVVVEALLSTIPTLEVEAKTRGH